jgi:hypothetical protein
LIAKADRSPDEEIKPAKGCNPLNPMSAAGTHSRSGQVAQSGLSGSGTPRGKEHAAAHDPQADDEPIGAVWRGWSDVTGYSGFL